MLKKERFREVLSYFASVKPNPSTELQYKNGYQLTIAVILSAQCTDKRVNQTTPSLFKKYPTVFDLAKAKHKDVLDTISNISYPNNKASYLIGMSRMLIEKFDNKIPSDIEILQTLPGIGRKTANVIVSVLYDIPAMPVDTHVFRVANRIGLSTRAKTPLNVEQQLVKNIPKKILSKAHHWLILHGRYICKSRKPLCDKCGINKFCKYFKKR